MRTDWCEARWNGAVLRSPIGDVIEVPVTALRFTEVGGSGSTGGAAPSVEGLISTRAGNAGAWLGIGGKSVAGEWYPSWPLRPHTSPHRGETE
jgi:hypothetical protein